MRALLSISVLALLLTGCGSQPPAPEQQPAIVEGRVPSAIQTQPVTPVEIKSGEAFDPMSMAALKDPRSQLSKRNVLFDYDSYIVKDEYQALLAAHGKFLAANSRMKMLIQGNADDRGSREHNLALGQKRADAVKKSLTLLGASDDQIESVSLGEEKSACSEATEACWAQNRRSDILYTGEF